MTRTQVLSLAIFVSGSAFFIYSCNKRNQDSSSKQIADQAAVKEQLKLKISNEGSTITFPVNQKIEAYYADKAGNRVSIPKHGTISTMITSACDYSNTPTVTLTYFGLNSQCGSGYTIFWTYLVSTNNNIVATNPVNPSLPTEGNIGIYSGRTALYTDNHCTAMITDVGVDPSTSGYELFTVSFTSNLVSVSNTSLFNSTNTLKLGSTLATNCNPDDENILTLAPYSYGAPLSNSCDRYEPTYQVLGPEPIEVYGAYALGCSQSGYVYPDIQEIEYSINGGSTWVGESSSSTLSYNLPPVSLTPYTNFLHYGYVDLGGALELQVTLSSGSYTILTRFRNIKYNHSLSFYGTDWPLPVPGTNCCAGPWSPITTKSVTY